MKKILSLFLLAGFTVSAQHINPLKLVLAMQDSIDAIKTMRFKVIAVERIENGYVKVVSENKLQVKPRKLYFVNKEKKIEILYLEGQNGGKAIVKPNVFPYLTMKLSPTGSLMRKNQHHTIHEIGFEYTGKAIQFAIAKEKENMAKCVSYLGLQVKNGIKCHLLVYETKNFAFTDYTTSKDETVSSIANKLHISDYIIRAKNNLYTEFGSLKTGTQLKIPMYYCKKAVFYLDEKTLLPVSVSVFDDIGLLENYDFADVIVNKPIDNKEFTESYKDYHF
ncbi:MAG: LysM peptidoglycan-binding domain-containing protein [Bacteroidia bacterium]